MRLKFMNMVILHRDATVWELTTIHLKQPKEIFWMKIGTLEI